MLKKEKGEGRIKMKAKLFTVVTLAILMLSMFAVLPVHAQVATIRVLPATISLDTTTAHVGDEFWVGVWLEYTANVAGYQVYMEFNPQVLNVTEWREPTTNPNYIFFGMSTSALPAPPDAGWMLINPTKASVQVMATLFPPVQNPGGAPSGLLCEFKCNVTSLPPKYGSLTTTLNVDSLSTYFIDYVTGTFYGDDAGEVTKFNCVYTITWVAPPAPNMGLDPLTKIFGPDLLVVGQEFSEEVRIEALSAAWFLTSASFTLTYNATVISIVGGLANVTIDPNWIGPPPIITENPSPAILDTIAISVTWIGVGSPSDTVLVATIDFTVMIQQTVPPAPVGTYDKSDLTFSDVHFTDHIGPIPVGANDQGEVRVYAYLMMKKPWLEVVPPLTEKGPAPVLYEEFDVGVKVTGPPPDYLDERWYLIGIQFMLFYDADLLEVVKVTQGPFLEDPTWNWYGKFFYGESESNGLGPHVVVAEMLLPNPETWEWDMTEFPNGEGVIANITFKIIKQNVCPCNFTWSYLGCALELTGVAGEYAVDKNGEYIPFDPAVDGLYKIYDTPSSNGRIIDVYGGAVNRGYGPGVTYGTPSAFPAPYGGQGQNKPMDLVIPQSVVYLLARVTYNCWPVQSKDVGYEIEGPFYQEGWTPENPVPKDIPPFHIRKYTNRTGDVGIAWIKFQMPWPCENPEDYFGKYRVTATVDICGVVVKDTLWFDYYYLVEIVKVTTDKYYYQHCEDVHVTIEYRWKAQQYYPVLFAIVIQDELETGFGYSTIDQRVGGAPFCHWRNWTDTTDIHVVKWAFAGFAHIYVSAFDKDPTDGGAPWCPTFGIGWPPGEPLPEIYILPA